MADGDAEDALALLQTGAWAAVSALLQAERGVAAVAELLDPHSGNGALQMMLSGGGENVDEKTALLRRLLVLGFDASRKNLFGVTPLMFAAHAGSAAHVELLLAAGADAAALNAAGGSAADAAWQRQGEPQQPQQLELVLALVAAGSPLQAGCREALCADSAREQALRGAEASASAAAAAAERRRLEEEVAAAAASGDDGRLAAAIAQLNQVVKQAESATRIQSSFRRRQASKQFERTLSARQREEAATAAAAEAAAVAAREEAEAAAHAAAEEAAFVLQEQEAAAQAEAAARRRAEDEQAAEAAAEQGARDEQARLDAESEVRYCRWCWWCWWWCCCCWCWCWCWCCWCWWRWL